MTNGWIGHDPERIDQLRVRVNEAVDDLRSLHSDDPVAAAALRDVDLALLHLETDWLPLIERVRGSQAMAAPVGGLAVDGLEWGCRDWWDLFCEPSVPTIGAGNLVIPPSAEVVRFDIPVWEGSGVTRIQYFIDDDDVCLSGTGPDIACGHGDHRDFATGEEITDYNLPARVRVVLDHENGTGTVIAYATHGEDGEIDALPIEMTLDGPVELPDDHPSQFRQWTDGEGIDGNIVFDYRFLNSETPDWIAGAAPSIIGAIRLQQGPDCTVEIDGRLGQYPSVEIIRDEQLPNGYRSTRIFVKEQESGGPLNLYEPGERFEVAG